MRTAVLLAAGALCFQMGSVSAAHAQLARIGGDAELRSDVSTMIALAPAPASSATIESSVVEAGAEIDGNLRARSTGAVRLALAAGPASDASITEATVCGDVHGDANLTSHMKGAFALSLTPGGNSRISSASVGHGPQGSVGSFVSTGTVVAVDFLPFVDSTVILGSTRGGC